jgi:quercetin dioxygenase-like cupin family protein
MFVKTPTSAEETIVNTVTISEGRRFSLDVVEKSELVDTEDLQVQLLCFEAGQRDQADRFDKTCIYQVLEGEALFREGDANRRLGKGKLLTVPGGTEHAIENAGGGLLVVMATRAR